MISVIHKGARHNYWLKKQQVWERLVYLLLAGSLSQNDSALKWRHDIDFFFALLALYVENLLFFFGVSLKCRWASSRYVGDLRRHDAQAILRNYPDSKVHGANMGPPGSCWPQIGPMLAPWTLLLGYYWVQQYTTTGLTTSKPHHSACVYTHMLGLLWSAGATSPWD